MFAAIVRMEDRAVLRDMIPTDNHEESVRPAMHGVDELEASKPVRPIAAGAAPRHHVHGGLGRGFPSAPQTHEPEGGGQRPHPPHRTTGGRKRSFKTLPSPRRAN